MNKELEALERFTKAFYNDSEVYSGDEFDIEEDFHTIKQTLTKLDKIKETVTNMKIEYDEMGLEPAIPTDIYNHKKEYFKQLDEILD